MTVAQQIRGNRNLAYYRGLAALAPSRPSAIFARLINAWD
jgi:hypothetical protein